MRLAITAPSILSVLILASGCDSDQVEIGDDFRQFDVDIQLSQADGGEEDGTILWEIVEAEGFDGPAIAGDLSLYLEDDRIHAAIGEQTCVIHSPNPSGMVREVRSVDGTVLLTVWGDYVFAGSIDPSITNFAWLRLLFGDQLLFEFSSDTVFLGEARDGFSLVQATVNLESAGYDHKLLISAMITGECGASGMPGYTF